MALLEHHAGNEGAAQSLEKYDFRAMQKAFKKYPLFMINFFTNRAWSFINNVSKDALDIKNYWG